MRLFRRTRLRVHAWYRQSGLPIYERCHERLHIDLQKIRRLQLLRVHHRLQLHYRVCQHPVPHGAPALHYGQPAPEKCDAGYGFAHDRASAPRFSAHHVPCGQHHPASQGLQVQFWRLPRLCLDRFYPYREGGLIPHGLR